MSLAHLGASRPTAALFAAAVVALLLFASPAGATQHLIHPGRNWESFDGRIRPGDEILLLPGNHRPAKFDKLRGTKNRPITIRALDPKRETVIHGDRYGLRIRQPQHLVIEDLTIRGATINGIMVTDRDRRNRVGATTSDITIRNVRIYEIGPRGKRNGIQAYGVENLVIENCTFEGWAGAGVDIVGCRNVDIRHCQFTGRAEFSQECGVQIAAGSKGVRVTSCRFFAPGEIGVRIGRKSRDEDFRPPLPDQAQPGSIFEAQDVQVRKCLIVDALCAVSMAHASNCTFHGNTFMRPRECFIEVIIERDDPRFGLTGKIVLANNLVVWDNSDMLRLVHVDGGIENVKFQLDQNLWWSKDPLETRKRVVATVPADAIYPQVVDVDPHLGDDFLPTTRGTELFGARGP